MATATEKQDTKKPKTAGTKSNGQKAGGKAANGAAPDGSRIASPHLLQQAREIHIGNALRGLIRAEIIGVT